MTTDVGQILQAMRADCVSAGMAGLWSVVKGEITQRQHEMSIGMARIGKLPRAIPIGNYTWLYTRTMASMMEKHGETVMNDFPCELKKHLQFIMEASGRVLVGGLGLGCVVRGLLARGAVEHIDVIERSESVIRLCGDSVSDPRVRIQKRDALNGFVKGGPWDFAWWDLHSNDGEPHLQVTHMQLIAQFHTRVKHVQGAWAMRRIDRRLLSGVVL